MSYGTVNADVIGTSVAGSHIGAGNASIMKNRIINGAMTVSQYNGTSSVTPTATGYVIDRFTYFCGGVASKFALQQLSASPPVGFGNYLGATSQSAYSVSATDRFGIYQAIEGFNTYDLQWGTANAKTVTLSAWVYSSLTGTFGGAIQNYAQNRSYPFTYTISSANTWTQISITIAGDTSGTWVGATNAGSMIISFGLGVGATYSGTAGSWSGNLYYSATGATSVVGTSGATFYITGVQLEVGSSATGYEYRQYGQELALCQRYYEVMNGVVFQSAVGGSNREGSWRFCNDKRATPTIALNNSVNSPTVDSSFTTTSIVSIYNSTGTYFSANITASAEL